MDALARSNTGAGDKANASRQEIKTGTTWPETDEGGEFDFASLAFAPLTASKLTDKKKSAEFLLPKQTQSETFHAREGQPRTAYGYVVKSRRQGNGNQHSPVSKTNTHSGLSPASNIPSTWRLPHKSATKLGTSSSGGSGPSLDTLRANMSKATPMTTPTLDRHPSVQQKPEEGKDCFRSSGPNQVTDKHDTRITAKIPQSPANHTTLRTPRTIAPHPRVQFLQQQSGRPAKPVFVGHRLPQLVHEPRSGSQIAEPATNNVSETQVQQQMISNSPHGYNSTAIKTRSSNMQYFQSTPPNKGGHPARQSNPVFNNSIGIPYYYSSKYFPSRYIMTSNHPMNSKSSPVARHDQPPQSYPYFQMPNYSHVSGMDQQQPSASKEQKLVPNVPYRIPANQTKPSGNMPNDNNHCNQQLFSSIPVPRHRSKLEVTSRSPFRVPHLPQNHLQDPIVVMQSMNRPSGFHQRDGSHLISSPKTSLAYSRYRQAEDQRQVNRSLQLKSTHQLGSTRAVPQFADGVANHQKSRHSSLHELLMPSGPQLNFNNDNRFSDTSRCAETRVVPLQNGKRPITSTGAYSNINLNINRHSPRPSLKVSSRSMPSLLSSNHSPAPEDRVRFKDSSGGNGHPSVAHINQATGSTSTPEKQGDTCSHLPSKTKFTEQNVDHSKKEKSKSTSSKDAAEISIKSAMHKKESHSTVQRLEYSGKNKNNMDTLVQQYVVRKVEETSRASLSHLRDTEEDNRLLGKVNKEKKLIAQCPDKLSSVASRKGDRGGEEEFDDDERASRFKVTQQVAPLFKKALKMLQTQRRILAKPGDVVPGPVPSEEHISVVQFKPMTKVKSREHLAGRNTDVAKEKPEGREKFKIKRQIKNGRKRFASMSKRNKNKSITECSTDVTNKGDKQCAEKMRKETTLRDDWLVEDDEDSGDCTVHYYFKKAADDCNDKRVTRARSISESESVSNEHSDVKGEHGGPARQNQITTELSSETSTRRTTTKAAKKKISKRRKIIKSKNKVGHGVTDEKSGRGNSADEPNVVEKKDTSCGRRKTLASLSAVAWEECREVTLEQWCQHAERKGLPRKQIDEVIAIDKPEISSMKRNGPPADFQELLVKTWQDVIVRSSQKIEGVKGHVSGDSQDAECVSSPSQTLAQTLEDGDNLDNGHIVQEHSASVELDSKTRFDIFVKSVIDNAERECDLVTEENDHGKDRGSTCQDWQTWEKQVEQRLQTDSECGKGDTKEVSTKDTDCTDNEVAEITSGMCPTAEIQSAQKAKEQAELRGCSPNTEADLKVESLPPSFIVDNTDYYDCNNFVGDQPIGYRVQWHVDEDAEGYFVHDNDVIYIDDQTWPVTIETEVVEVCDGDLYEDHEEGGSTHESSRGKDEAGVCDETDQQESGEGTSQRSETNVVEAETCKDQLN